MHGRRQQLAEAASRGEMQEKLAAVGSLADRLVEKWSRSRPGIRLDKLYQENRHKARITALGLENQNRHLKGLSETQIKTEFSTVPENVLRIVRIGIANSNRGDIFTEWPMTTTDDAVYFVDKVFGKSFRGATAGQRIYDYSNTAPNYGTEMDLQTGGTGDGVTTTFSFTLGTVPVVPYTVRVLQAGRYIASDDGTGKFTGTGLNLTTSTINYTTGAVTLVFAVAPPNGDTIQVEWNWDSEVSDNYPNYGDVELRVTKKRFNARIHPLGYSYTKLVELQLTSTGLGNPQDMLVKAVGDEHAMRRDYKAFQYARRLALGNPIVPFNADFAAAGEDNDYNHAQRILSTISDTSGAIYDDIKRGVINKIVGGSKAVTYFKKNKLWETDRSQPRVGGSFYAGRLDDIDVYQAPADSTMVANNEALMIFKNPDEEGDISIAFGTMTEIAAALDYPEFYKVANVGTIEDHMFIQPKYIRLMRISNLP